MSDWWLNIEKIIVLGGGESGVGAALLAQAKGYDVFLSDKGTLAPQYKADLIEKAIAFEEGKHSIELILNADLVIKSPGIPDSVELIQAIKAKGIQVISEIEFGSYFTKAKLIGITGSNGKTTTTNLIYHFLKEGGLNVALAGNIGHSFARQVAFSNPDFYVLELSSFQLDDCHDLKLEVAVLLNITPDHLDRYDYNLELYADSKMKIGQNQTAEDLFIFNGEDEIILRKLNTLGSKAKKMAILSSMWEEGIVWDDEEDHSELYENASLPLKGKHNAFNTAAAISAVKAIGLDQAAIMNAFPSFVNDPHRLESVAIIEGVEFINDSKATNVDATFFALDAMEAPVVWIVGGTDKGNDYTPLMDLVKTKVTGIVCLGLDNHKLLENFSELVPNIFEVKSAKEAVAKAKELAEDGTTVLLSPACASFDLFKNYKDRGNQFKEAVNQLK